MTDSIFKSNLDLIVICGFFMQSISGIKNRFGQSNSCVIAAVHTYQVTEVNSAHLQGCQKQSPLSA